MNLKINDRIQVRDIEFFNDFVLNLRYDSLSSTFNFGFYFDSTNPDHRELACVSHYHEAIIEHNGQRMMTGFILAETFTDQPAKQLTQFAGYSLPGVLEDCQIPTDLYPLQSDGLNLRQIAEKLVRPFKLKIIVDESVSKKMDKVFPKTTANATQSIKEYLNDLASSRDIVMSHDSNGALLFTSAKVDQQPILIVGPEGIPGVSMTMAFSGQQIHSHITVIKQASADGGNAGEFTIRNPYVPIVYRPKVITQNSGDDNDTATAARMALSEELRNIVLTVNIDRWEIDGKLILPNNVIRVRNPNLFIFKQTDWFIESIAYKGDNLSNTATLTCVLPEVHNKKSPKNIFVDPHENAPTL
jgi:prophage tail gpP-like protein